MRAGDIEHLALHMKCQDRLELKAVFNADPEDGLRQSLAYSAESYVLARNGEPLAIGGVTPTEHGGLAWLLTADNVTNFGRRLTLASARHVERFLKQYGQLYNYVAQTNTHSLRWLEVLGFKRGLECEIGGVPFVLMTKRRT